MSSLSSEVKVSMHLRACIFEILSKMSFDKNDQHTSLNGRAVVQAPVAWNEWLAMLVANDFDSK